MIFYAVKALFISSLVLAAGVFGSPVAVDQAKDNTLARRQLESQSTVITSLFQQVIAHTQAINSSLAAAPQNPTPEEAAAAAIQIAPDLTAITSALTLAKGSVAKRDTEALAQRQTACDAECIATEIVALVNEIVSTIKAIIQQLGLAPVVVYINPLLLALSGLVITLDALVTGLLLTVTAIVNTLLLGLGLSLAALGFSAS